MAQDNREFLKLCSHVDKLLHRHDMVLLYKYMLDCRGEIINVFEQAPNEFRVKIKYWSSPLGPNSIAAVLEEKDLILRPREEDGQ